jgi:hypothetical protein
MAGDRIEDNMKLTRGGAGRGQGRKPPEVQKVRLSTWVLPSTKAALGPKPGAKLDDLFGGK